MVFLHLRSLSLANEGAALAAFQSSLQSSDLLYAQMESEKESNWSLPLISLQLRTLRLLSYAADAERVRLHDKPRHVVEAQDVLKRYLQKMVVDRSGAAVSKKRGCLFIIVGLFKVYFRLNNLKMCSYLIKMIKMLPPLPSYSLADQVAYHFYYGRLMVFEEQYGLAEEALDFAFRHCDPRSAGNQRRILLFLVPVALLHGRYPRQALLQRYGLTVFEGLIRAVRHGNLGDFVAELDSKADVWIGKGVYLLLEKLKVSVYRNLFRLVYLHVWGPQVEARGGNEKERVQLPLAVLLKCMKGMGVDMGMDELECVLANLIFNGQIKGYIAHQRCVVLSKADPFPKQNTGK